MPNSHETVTQIIDYFTMKYSLLLRQFNEFNYLSTKMKKLISIFSSLNAKKKELVQFSQQTPKSYYRKIEFSQIKNYLSKHQPLDHNLQKFDHKMEP